MALETNLAAINAARKVYGANYKEFVTIEKLGMREWSVQLRQLPQSDGSALITDYSGAFSFPTTATQVEVLDLTAELARADAIANSQASETTLKGGKTWVHMSSIPKPTKQVWFIADEMIAANPKATRAEIQAECVARGIASGTARTQYQAWKKAGDNDRLNAERAAEASKRFNGVK